jgi:hypothetical protein
VKGRNHFEHLLGDFSLLAIGEAHLPPPERFSKTSFDGYEREHCFLVFQSV